MQATPEKQKPLVSVITPIYNGARHLPHALENIRSCGYDKLEIILVDDASTDDSALCAGGLAASSSDIQFISLPTNAGPAAARNHGLERATGEIIAFLDVDDEWPPGSFLFRLNYLVENPEIEIALGKVQCVRHRLTGTSDGKPQREISEVFVSFNLGAALYRKNVFEKVGLLNPELRYGEDTDWFMRARELGIGLKILPEVGLIYHIHEGGMTHGKKATEMNMALMLKMSLDRRRREGNAQNLPGLDGMTETRSSNDGPGPHLRFSPDTENKNQ